VLVKRLQVYNQPMPGKNTDLTPLELHRSPTSSTHIWGIINEGVITSFCRWREYLKDKTNLKKIILQLLSPIVFNLLKIDKFFNVLAESSR